LEQPFGPVRERRAELGLLVMPFLVSVAEWAAPSVPGGGEGSG